MWGDTPPESWAAALQLPEDHWLWIIPHSGEFVASLRGIDRGKELVAA